ncbi:MAG: HAD family hydrolase [Bacillota bacterium]|jgi:phosphoglycolate phosphatase|nr:HAD family hydrolase [Bacillota bacterium]HHU43067.1 HAD family hydrolase [Clostridiales bacterium]
MAKRDRYDHILWDWNGTLFDDIEENIKAINISLKKKNLSPLTKEKYLQLFSFPIENFYKKIGFEFEDNEYQILAHEFIENYKKESMSAHLHNGVKELLDYFHKKRIGQSILSASEKTILEEKLSHFDIKKYFEDILALDNVYAESKAHLGIEWRKTKGKGKKAFMIGDTAHDFDVAKDMGIDCILFSGGHNKKEDLLNTGAIVVDNLIDIKDIL